MEVRGCPTGPTLTTMGQRTLITLRADPNFLPIGNPGQAPQVCGSYRYLGTPLAYQLQHTKQVLGCPRHA